MVALVEKNKRHLERQAHATGAFRGAGSTIVARSVLIAFLFIPIAVGAFLWIASRKKGARLN